jgi:transcriptional regulator with XRE-family HTH domain
MSFDRDAFGNRVDKLQKESGLNVTNFAKLTGVSFPSIRGYIRGDATPTIEVAVLITNNLGVNLLWFINGEGPQRKE